MRGRVLERDTGLQLQAVSEAYVKHQDAERYTATINQCQVVVSVSESLENAVHSIIDGLTR